MKFKLITLFIIILLMSGCSFNKLDTIDYELNIDSIIDETITFYVNKDDYDSAESNADKELASLEYILSFNNINVLNNYDDKYYEKNIEEKKDYYIIKLSYTYTIDEFLNANFINNCFEYSDISNGEYLDIDLYGRFYCLHDKKLNIKVKTKEEVLKYNGNKSGKKYKWYIDNNNKDDINIFMRIEY